MSKCRDCIKPSSYDKTSSRTGTARTKRLPPGGLREETDDSDGLCATWGDRPSRKIGNRKDPQADTTVVLVGAMIV